MIISRTPFRISFFGGGTDYPAFYEENRGAVLNTSINKYCYITVRSLPPFFDYNYRIRYTKREETRTIAEIQHPSVRECLKLVNPSHGVEVVHNADLPAMSGLGSSSAFTVGLLHALYALKGQITTKRQLALDAIHIEQDMIKENVGSQDQAIAAFGSFNKIEFGGQQKIVVYPITIEQSKLETLQKHLMLVFTGFSRSASQIAEEQIRITPEKKQELTAMMAMVAEAVNILNGSPDKFADFGKLLHETWQIKRKLTPHITTPFIDEVYQAAMEAGASGGKLMGAGGGGFMLFFVRPELQNRVRERLTELSSGKLLYVPFKFEGLGSQIIYYAPENNF